MVVSSCSFFLFAPLQAMLDKQAGIVQEARPKAPPSYPLLGIPDDELDEEERAAKRKQRFLKVGGWEGG